MAIDWRRANLGDICQFRAGSAFPTRYQGYTVGEFPFIKVSDMELPLNGRRIIQANHWVSDEVRRELNATIHPEGSTVFAKIGIALTFNRRRILTRPTIIDNNMMSATANDRNLDPVFLYYLLCQQDFNEIVSGTALPYLNSSDLSRIEVLFPPLREQRAIAHILGTLDDKIELNRCINETLEAISRVVFKSWFIDFDPVIDNALRAGNPIPSALAEKAARRRELLSRAKAEGRDAGVPKHIADLFPDSFEDCELGEIPHGWDIKAIGDVAERVAMGPFGSSLKVETFVPDGVPIISGQHLRGFMLEDNTFNFITYEHAERLGNAIVQRGDVVFTHAGNIGQAAFIPNTSRYEHYVISQRQFYLRCDLSRISPTYIALFFSSHRGRNLLLANTSSSGVPSIARPVTYLRSIRLLIPKKVVLDEFERLLKPLLLLYRQNKETNLTLAALRDMLLPKLVSGELRVKDSENYVRGSV